MKYKRFIILLFLIIQKVNAGWWEDFPGLDDLISEIIHRVFDAIADFLGSWLNSFGKWIYYTTTSLLNAFTPGWFPDWIKPVTLVAGAGLGLWA